MGLGVMCSRVGWWVPPLGFDSDGGSHRSASTRMVGPTARLRLGWWVPPLGFDSETLLVRDVPRPFGPRLLELPPSVCKVVLARLRPILCPLQSYFKLLPRRPPIGHLRTTSATTGSRNRSSCSPSRRSQVQTRTTPKHRNGKASSARRSRNSKPASGFGPSESGGTECPMWR
jgi:hypothetical protein